MSYRFSFLVVRYGYWARTEPQGLLNDSSPSTCTKGVDFQLFLFQKSYYLKQFSCLGFDSPAPFIVGCPHEWSLKLMIRLLYFSTCKRWTLRCFSTSVQFFLLNCFFALVKDNSSQASSSLVMDFISQILPQMWTNNNKLPLGRKLWTFVIKRD